MAHVSRWVWLIVPFCNAFSGCKPSAQDRDFDVESECTAQFEQYARCDLFAVEVHRDEFVLECEESLEGAAATSDACRTATEDWIVCSSDALVDTCDEAALMPCQEALDTGCEMGR